MCSLWQRFTVFSADISPFGVTHLTAHHQLIDPHYEPVLTPILSEGSRARHSAVSCWWVFGEHFTFTILFFQDLIIFKYFLHHVDPLKVIILTFECFFLKHNIIKKMPGLSPSHWCWLRAFCAVVRIYPLKITKQYATKLLRMIVRCV